MLPTPFWGYYGEAYIHTYVSYLSCWLLQENLLPYEQFFSQFSEAKFNKTDRQANKTKSFWPFPDTRKRDPFGSCPSKTAWLLLARCSLYSFLPLSPYFSSGSFQCSPWDTASLAKCVTTVLS